MQPISDISDRPINPEQHEMLVYLSDTNLLLLFYDFTLNKFSGLKHFKLHSEEKLSISDIKNNFEDFSKNFKKRKLLYFSPKYTLIPSAIFNENLTDQYFSINFNKEDQENIRKEKIESPDSYLIYSADFQFTKFNLALKPDWIGHLTGQLLAISEKDFSGKHSSFILVHVEDLHITCIVRKSGQLVLANTYPVFSDLDIVYLLYRISQTTGLDPHTDGYYFTGNVKRDSILFNELYKYIKYPILSVPVNHSPVAPCFSQIPAQMFITLTLLTR